MGLLSDLMNKTPGVLNNALKDIANAVSSLKGSEQSSAEKAPEASEPAVIQPAGASPMPGGRSWGYTMPNEENQFSFQGTYDQYFENIYRSEFSDYQLNKQTDSRTTVFRFEKDGKLCLVVELLSKKSSAKKIRRDCQADGIPYLRYYYDYHGWWNTRSYVIDRTRSALR